MISLIIRTKNEEAWLARCLRAVQLQRDCDYEVVIVDNESVDDTRRIAADHGCRIVDIPPREFTYGRALNVGIRESRGELVALLSGHCIPVHERWLARLAVHFGDQQVAGAYGRQEPLPESSDFDKRDLWTTFGLERRVQTRDYFFHNANSMIRRSVWEQFPFDEEIAGVEDREWARRILAQGWRIVYEPRASVYHHHGIHQGRDEARAARVARVIELINGSR